MSNININESALASAVLGYGVTHFGGDSKTVIVALIDGIASICTAFATTDPDRTILQIFTVPEGIIPFDPMALYSDGYLEEQQALLEATHRQAEEYLRDYLART